MVSMSIGGGGNQTWVCTVSMSLGKNQTLGSMASMSSGGGGESDHECVS